MTRGLSTAGNTNNAQGASPNTNPAAGSNAGSSQATQSDTASVASSNGNQPASTPKYNELPHSAPHMNVFTNIPSHVEIVGLKTQPKKQQIRIGEDETFAPPSWKTRDLTRKQKTRNLIAAAICLLVRSRNLTGSSTSLDCECTLLTPGMNFGSFLAR